MRRILVLFMVILISISVYGLAFSSETVWDVKSDTWVATDALGRELPGYDEVGPIRDGKYVGIFYFTYQGLWGTTMGGNVTEILMENPENPNWGPHYSAHFWAEPELGYYFMNDEYVLRQHAYMLADAGVDVVIFDTTNRNLHTKNYMTLLKVWQEMRDMGEKTPQIAFFLRVDEIKIIYGELYEKGLYQDLWFYWKGKPLLITLDGFEPLAARWVPAVREAVDFFTIRLGTDSQGGQHRFPWIDWWPQKYGWDETPKEAEFVNVCVARHPTTNVGRSYHDRKQPPINEYHLTGREGEGLHFAQQWTRALQLDPEFIFITGWNEWAASRYIYDGHGDSTFVGKRLNIGDTYFIDTYNMEYSRDIEPMKGGFTDNYYYQMIANIRRFKGVREPEVPTSPRTIDISGGFDQWDDIGPEYRDHIGDTAHRHSVGYNNIEYVNTTGRNDFMRMKVTYDDEYIYFYAETNEEITPYTDPNWMLLFINIDMSNDSGWEGYDYLVNWEVLDDKTTTIMKTKGGWEWETIGEIPYRVEGKRLHLKIPRSHLGIDNQDYVAFDFKWADNIQKEDDITEFFVNGDTAPSRRFNYRYDTRHALQ